MNTEQSSQQGFSTPATAGRGAATYSDWIMTGILQMCGGDADFTPKVTASPLYLNKSLNKQTHIYNPLAFAFSSPFGCCRHMLAMHNTAPSRILIGYNI